MNVTRVIRWTGYRPRDFKGTDPVCPVCNKSMGHSITMIVEVDHEGEAEIHSDCLSNLPDDRK